MALISCPECSRQISDRADTCPGCGLPAKFFQQVEAPIQPPPPLPIIDVLPDFEAQQATQPLPDRYISETDIQRLTSGANDSGSIRASVAEHNAQWIKTELIRERLYFDSILSKVDPTIHLDEEQRKAILTDDEYCLIVAGAGAGKTTTMAAKVKYLVDRKRVRPERIIVISFTNKAVDELKERINARLGIPTTIVTFHKFGLELIKKAMPEAPGIHFTPASLVTDYFEKMVVEDSAVLRKVLYFFSFYFDVPEEALQFETLEQYHYHRAAQDLLTLKSNLNEYTRQVLNNRTKVMRTCQGEYLRSYQEVQIANFLYLHGLDYEYERHYEHPLLNLTKPYTPDFFVQQGELAVYLEHFGVSEEGTNSIFTPAQLRKYQSGIQDKRAIHGQYGSTMLETYSSYRDGRPLLEHLREELLKAGFTLLERPLEDVYRKLVETSKDKYIFRFVDFLVTFISRFKTNGYGTGDFEQLRKRTDNVRTLLFLDIAEAVYSNYQNALRNRNCIDFDDMINEAENILEHLKQEGRKLPLDYIIIDEYQDISLQRFQLARRLAEVTDAKVIAVGDDWQSIFAFAGSDITLFTRFLKLMGSGKELQITHTYRNSQQLIDIAGGFIQKNNSQIQKHLISPKQLQDPIRVVIYEDTQKIMENKAKALVGIIGELLQEFGSSKKILLIGRYNFDLYHFVKTPHFEMITDTRIRCKEHPQADITFLTAHTSKGMGFDNVVLLNAIDHKFGFPCQIEDDPIMKLVIHEDRTIPYAEERRLFYVALTRTKNRLIVLAPKNHPSRFLVELVNDFGVQCNDLSTLTIDDSWKLGLKCPQCGFPLRFEPFKISIGLPLYICTNEPEICDFMTNSRERLVDIQRCNRCDDGYLIVKKRKKDNHFFLGCTNYKEHGDGCRNAMEIPIV